MSANFVKEVDDTYSENGGSNSIVMSAINVSAGELIVVGVRWEGGGLNDSATASISDTGENTYTNIGYQVSGSGSEDEKVSLFACLNSAADSSNVITISISSSRSYRNAVASVYSYDGTIEIGDNGDGNSSSNTNPWPTSPPLNVVAGDLAIGMFGNYNGIGSDGATGYTEISPSNYASFVYKVATGTGTESPQSGGGNDTYAGLSVVFQEAAAAGPEYSGASTVSGGGTVTSSGEKGGSGSSNITAGGDVVSSGLKAASGSSIISAGGAILTSGQKSTSGNSNISAGGSVISSGIKATVGTSTISAGGQVVNDGFKGGVGSSVISGGGTIISSGFADGSISGTSVISAGGSVISSGAKGADGSSIISDGGNVVSGGVKGGIGSNVISGGGQIIQSGVKHATGGSIVFGGGNTIQSGSRQAVGVSVVSGGGTVVNSGKKHAGGASIVSGGGQIISVGSSIPPNIIISNNNLTALDRRSVVMSGRFGYSKSMSATFGTKTNLKGRV